MIYPFDEQKERNVLMNQVGQLGTPKPYVTRAMTQQFFDRLKIYNQVHQHRYLGAASVAQFIDNVISRGYDQCVFLPFGVVELHHATSQHYYMFTSRPSSAGYQYIKMLFTEPSYWGLIES